MRTFDTGATRDGENGKLDYEAFFSPAVLEQMAQYMHRHRLQSDGTLRAGDNWQKGISIESYQKSLVRHLFQAWQTWRGDMVIDDKGKVVELDEALCAIIFNASGYLFERQKLKP